MNHETVYSRRSFFILGGMNNRPLAERVRPQSTKEIIGQQHLLGPKGPLQSYIELGRLPSILLWGPPGTGKTTLAMALSEDLDMQFHSLSAISSGVKDLRKLIDKAKSSDLFQSRPTLLFIDEIHRFNKAQQDALLDAVEKGVVTLIGATTENPSFSINNALLSRCIVFQLRALSLEELRKVLKRALENDEWLQTKRIEIESDRALLARSGGDARKLLNLLEYLAADTDVNELMINDALVNKKLKENQVQFDRKGDHHYDTVSAFIKSVRGSDIQASVYYLARMIAGGEDPEFIARRLIILASEDIGLANPNALLIANACLQSIQQIGMPEGRIALSQCTVYLASSPKSNSCYKAIDEAIAFVKSHQQHAIPLHLRNAPTTLMKELGYGNNYKYPHDQPGNYACQQYLPDEIKDIQFFSFSENSSENRLKSMLTKRKEMNKGD